MIHIQRGIFFEDIVTIIALGPGILYSCCLCLIELNFSEKDEKPITVFMTYNVLCLLAKYMVGDKNIEGDKHKHKQVTFWALGIGHRSCPDAHLTLFP